MDFTDLHALLHATYGEMMPLCAHMTGIAKGIAGLGALFYIALRIWSSLARAEPIDVFPLLRPFVLGFCIMFFPSVVLGTVNAVLSPVVQGTEKLVHVQQNDLQSLRDQRDKLEEDAYRRDKSRAYLVDDAAWDEKVQEMGFIGPEDAITLAGMYAERTAFNTKRWFVKKVYQALPVSSILTALLTKIQVLMISKDIAELQNPGYVPDSGDWYYIVFFLIGIVGFFCVPTVAGWIIEAGGGIGNYGRNVNQTAQRGVQGAYTGGKVTMAGTGAALGNAGGRIKGLLIK